MKTPIGSIVRYNAPEPDGEKHWARGRVIANETYEDDLGIRKWVYVRWYNDNGKPDADTMKHSAEELILVEAKTGN